MNFNIIKVAAIVILFIMCGCDSYKCSTDIISAKKIGKGLYSVKIDYWMNSITKARDTETLRVRIENKTGMIFKEYNLNMTKYGTIDLEFSLLYYDETEEKPENVIIYAEAGSFNNMTSRYLSEILIGGGINEK